MPLYGITHDRDTGTALVRVPRVIKVSIGLPGGDKSPDKHVYIDRSNKWVLQTGVITDGKRKAVVRTFESMEECQKAFQHAEVAARPYPVRLAYFTFTKPGHDGTQSPDWEAIRQHGILPNAIPVILVDDEPLHAEYQLWSASELRCHGDGRDAKRLVSMDPQNREAKKAKEQEMRRFAICGGCATRGCPYYAVNLAATANKKGADCKPHAELRFQLLDNLMLGGTAYYVTTGRRSIVNLYSCLEQFKSVTGGRVAGAQMMFVMAPYRTKTPDGKTTTQYAVHLEFRAGQAAALRSKLVAATQEFRAAGLLSESTRSKELGPGPAPTSLVQESEIPTEGQPITEKTDEDFAAESADAAAFNAEFNGGAEGNEDGVDTGDGQAGDEIQPLDELIDPTLAGQLYGAAKAKNDWSRSRTDQEFHDFLLSDGDVEKAKLSFMRYLEMVSTAANLEEPQPKRSATELPKDSEYER